VEQAFARAGLEYRPTLQVSHHQTLLNMVGAGLGVALLPSICIPAGKQSGWHVVPLRPRSLAREICILTLRGKTLTPAAAECAGMIAALLRKNGSSKKAREPALTSKLSR
jgi:DNA-binding transcriptional LysR family regulator